MIGNMVGVVGVVEVIRQSAAMEVRNNLGELLNDVQYRGDRIVIARAGKPVAALVDYRYGRPRDRLCG